MPDFTHLHVHSEYSLLDGLARIADLVAQAKAQGMGALALTDHGVMHGALDFYKAAQTAGIKPIVGCEVYCAQRKMTDRQPKLDSSPYHLTLLARDAVGYRNLIKLVSKASLDGFYYKPRVDLDLLAEYHEGIVALSGCLGAQVPQLLLQGLEEEARRTIGWFRETFGPEGYYLELQDHQIPEQQAINRFLVDYGRREGLPLVCTNDVHYVQADDAYAQDILLCVQTATTVDDIKRMRMSTQEFYLKSSAAMAALFAEVPEALLNTCRIADNCDLKLEFGRTALPEFALPEGHTAESYFREITMQRLPERYSQIDDRLRRRVQYEIDVICQLGFAQYILIVADFTFWARQRGIMAEPRGSVGGSVVAYVIGISDVDPIRYDLPFERFLSPDRHEMPDIDLDFPDDRRAEVYEYVKQKYGADHVAQIITYNTMLGKAAIRDVGRALGLPFGDVDRVAKLIPNGVKVTIDQGLAESAELRTLAESDQMVKKLLDTARKVEGLARNSSVHAAGVVISREPLMDMVPLQRAKDGNVITQYESTWLQDVGLLKMDFLGLANFANLDLAVKFIKQTRDLDINIKELPYDDAATFALLQTGETTGLFQLESAGMRKYLKELKPTNIGDISAMISLYRPGPMDNIPKFIAAKNGKIDDIYLHADLEPILAESYGVIVYQEQVMAIAISIAGFATEQGYKFIKAIAKKNAELLQKNKEPFVAGTIARGYSAELAEGLWRLFEPFQRYSFNKAHAMGYAHITYRTAYLKAHFTAEYMAAVLCSRVGDSEDVAAAIAECRRMGVDVLPPSVNESDVNFSVENGAIRFGLSAIKNVGGGAVEGLVEERRKHGPFASAEDFCSRIDMRAVNKKTLESLIRAGALDGFGDRMHLLQEMERMVGLAQQAQRKSAAGQLNMFGGGVAEAPALFNVPPREQDPATLKERLAWERELLGVYLGEHPLNAMTTQLQARVSHTVDQLTEEVVGQKVTMGGIINSVRAITTRNGQNMVYAELEDPSGTIEVVVFPRTLEQTKALWQADSAVIVGGKLDQRGDRYQLACDSVEAFSTAADLPRRYFLRLTIPQLDDLETGRARLERVAAALRVQQGEDPVEVRVNTPMGLVRLATPGLRTAYTAELAGRLVQLLGRDAMQVEELAPVGMAAAS
ncbi:MAG: DNA polymerase III subunit alpha [Chloroflexota bacterium]